MISLTDLLAFWKAGPEPIAAAKALKAYWQRPEDWLREALAQADIANCSSAALAMHARDRGIPRFPGESEASWRNRVQHALIAAIESGSRKGLEAILTAIGLQNFTIIERDPGQDWDVILIDLDPTQLSLDSDNLNEALHFWGRLCRRYAPSYTMSAGIGVGGFLEDATFIFATASG